LHERQADVVGIDQDFGVEIERQDSQAKSMSVLEHRQVRISGHRGRRFRLIADGISA
jgi:hypothetical protein